jgi:hypothetical protein
MPSPTRPTLFAALLALPALALAQAAVAPSPATGDGTAATAGTKPSLGIGTTPERKVEGTKLLFLRLNLRIKLIEHNFVDLTPEQFNEHLTVAASLLQQLNDRPMIDEEVARADRAAQYLQNLVGTYLQLHSGH